jgi:hypothetical protein
MAKNKLAGFMAAAAYNLVRLAKLLPPAATAGGEDGRGWAPETVA